MSLDQLLASLRTDYIAQIPKKIDIIEAQIEAGQIDELRESFHKLKGTGKTYGIPEISELAEVIEDLCIRVPQTALEGARQGVAILKDIQRSREAGLEHGLAQDPRLLSLRKLLPN